MSTGRWIEGAIPLTVAIFWAGLYAFLALRIRREPAEPSAPILVRSLVYLAAARILEGGSLTLGIWTSRWWFAVTGLAIVGEQVGRWFARRRLPDG